MATGRSSFAKRQRDMAKKAKASAKRERKHDREGEEDIEDEEEIVDDGPKMSNEQIMQRMADLQGRYDDGQLDLDSFDEERASLMAQMVID
jgi:hypothetical protein